jgi:hypothetical protein
MHLVGNILEVCVDLGSDGAAFRNCRTSHACNVVQEDGVWGSGF